jgi:DNA adenine methylase
LELSPEVKTLIEPFAGGSSMGLAAGIENLVDKVILVEKNEHVSSFWKTILNGESEWMINQIENFEVTRPNVEEALAQDEITLREKAFFFLLHNRTSRGGITADGGGLLKHGENGKGLTSRWYPETLSRRIQKISEHSDRFEFVSGDGFEVMEQYADDKHAAFFIDPPYTVAGSRLYDDSEVDHAGLFKLMSQLKGTFLATYDDVEQIRSLSAEYDFLVEPILMKTTHHEQKFELLISQNFDWIS